MLRRAQINDYEPVTRSSHQTEIINPSGFEGDLVAVRRYVLDKATPLLPSENSVAIFGIAVGEAIAYLLSYGIERAAGYFREAVMARTMKWELKFQ